MKDTNLTIAKSKGYSVPDFYVIKFDDIVSNRQRLDDAIINADYNNISNLSDTLTSILYEILQQEKIKLSSMLAETNDPDITPLSCFAVRSSCTAEDSDYVSFAGQFVTHLDVPFDELTDRIINCMLSLYGENILRCAIDQKIDIHSLKMNVIVQHMVKADFSGVLFTANPLGILSECVIVVGRGRGDGVVEDKTETTTYFYAPIDNFYYYDGREDLLTHDIVTELIDIAQRLMADFDNKLLDIEFAIENDRIFILQIRPITTLNTDSPTILDNSNIVESYPGISLPLTDSFVNLVYSGVFRALAMRVLKSKRVLARYFDVFNNMVGSANGRMYYKISNWYTVIKFLPLNKKIIPIWQEMLGVNIKSHDEQKVKLSPLTRISTYINSIYELCHVPKNMKTLKDEFLKINDSFYQRFDEELSDTELVDLFEHIRKSLLAVWDVTLLNDMYAFVFTGLVKALLKKKHPNDYERISANYLSGISNIESMKPIKALAHLANIYKNKGDCATYRMEYDTFISLYGDRYLEELKLESKTFRTDHSLLDQKVLEYAQDEEKLQRLLSSTQIHKDIPKGEGKLFTFCLKRAMLGIKNRETSRLDRSRIYGMVRGIFLRLAQSFVSKGLICQDMDIFYLSLEEVFSLIDNPRDMKTTIANRKDEYAFYEKLPAYSRIIFADNEFNKTGASVRTKNHSTDSNILRGTPCSNGKAEGEALIVTDVSKVTDVKGKILVTKMTDPGWVYLLAGAAGIIATKGSLLSHTAIVSREIGIPSIVGVDQAIDIIENGDKLFMDGSSGIIEIHKTR